MKKPITGTNLLEATALLIIIALAILGTYNL
jgi:hypothetical protein